MPEITFLSALIGGLLTFLAPCTLPLIPAYIAFISGSSTKSESGLIARKILLFNALFFVLGFSVIFILFGLASGSLGKFLVLNRALLSQVGGVIVIVLGLSLLGVFPTMKGFAFRLPSFVTAGGPFGGFSLGVLFALGWTPCLGPILGTILVLAGTSGTSMSGALLLGVYSLGLAIPFILVAMLYGSTFFYVSKLQRYLPMISKVGACFIILIGILLVFGKMGVLNAWSGQVSPLQLDRFINFM